MQHRFKKTCYDKSALLNKCSTLKEFMKRLTKQSTENPDLWDEMTYRGDGFEALVEVLINSSPIDKRINITNYSPWNVKTHGSDMGVDGLGVSHDGTPHTVQVKFRSNVTEDLTANKDHISNFVAKSVLMHQGKDVDMTIFTTANDLLNVINEGMYHGKVNTLGYKKISKLIDKNDSFWAIFRKEMGI
jgi:Tfp pilus assembly major pilin PilA